MKCLPADLVPYRRTAEFTETTLPAGLRRRHTTRPGVWGRIHVVRGSLRYRILEPETEEHVLTPERDGVVEPGVGHEVELLGAVRFYVEFLRDAAADPDRGVAERSSQPRKRGGET